MFFLLGESFVFNMIFGLFSTVARVYDILLELVQSGGSLDSLTFENLFTAMYVLAGVFMVFRVTVSFLQMLLNPDLVSDKQAGASKVITRVVISVLMLLLFVPNGLVFGSTGLLNRIEDALLEEDGLINNIMPYKYENGVHIDKSNSDYSRYREDTAESESSKYDFFIENVYAANSLTCYYFKISEKTSSTQGNEKISIDKYYRVVFNNVSKDDKYTYKKISKSNNWYFYSSPSSVSVGNGAYKSKSGKDLKYTKLSSLKVKNKNESEAGQYYYGKDSKFTSCPPAIIGNYAQRNFSTASNASVGVNFPKQFYPNGLYGGKTSLKSLFNYANEIMSSHDDSLGVKYSSNSEDIETPSERDHTYLSDVSEQSIEFAQNTAGSFIECGDGVDCEDIHSNLFVSDEGNDEVVDMMKSEDLHLDWIMGMIAGIGLIVYLIILCVDVIVRKFKLMLLEMMAPIPIISYVDPKDQVFNRWMKMYIAVYLDLFIKLLAISLAMNLLLAIDDIVTDSRLLLRFFYIVAILVFAKLVPSMISKIFGLDSMGGSFKDIIGMGKSAAGFGAGAAIGGIAGLATGKGLGRVTGAIGGAIRGAGSGMKGNVMGGAQSISKHNDLVNKQKDDGLKLHERLLIGASNATGIPLSGKKAQEQMKLANDVQDKRKNLDSWAGDELKKKGATIEVTGKIARIENPDGTITEVQNAILSKDKSKVVTAAGEGPIDMKTEYARQQQLNGLTLEQWDRMSLETKIREFGEHVGSIESFTSAKVEMNDRIAALEDYGKAERINIALADNDAEAVKVVGELRDSITNAQNGGISITQVPADNNYNNKTLKNAKDQANKEFNRVGKENAQSLKRSKYTTNDR